MLFVGEAADGRSRAAGVKGDRDPGYGPTSKMIAESAVCLLQDAQRHTWRHLDARSPWGTALIARLGANAGLTFAVEA